MSQVIMNKYTQFDRASDKRAREQWDEDEFLAAIDRRTGRTRRTDKLNKKNHRNYA